MRGVGGDTVEGAMGAVSAVGGGVTAGLQTVDGAGGAGWLESIQAGNIYVSRGITGAIVRRQPFGGWKRSAIGSTTKAGGPSYLLGSIYDGMYLEAIQKDLGDLDTVLENGRILDITHWLKEKIHRFGSMYNSKEVIERVCGKEISAQPLLRYFEEKYSKVYEF